MNNYTKIFDFLDGKKTTIGAVLLFAVYVARGVNTFFAPVFDEALLTQITNAGEVIVGIGLGHKVIKKM